MFFLANAPGVLEAVAEPVDVFAPLPRPEHAQQRKRKKYRRSKTGCLTCRVRKIKVN